MGNFAAHLREAVEQQSRILASLEPQIMMAHETAQRFTQGFQPSFDSPSFRNMLDSVAATSAKLEEVIRNTYVPILANLGFFEESTAVQTESKPAKSAHIWYDVRTGKLRYQEKTIHTFLKDSLQRRIFEECLSRDWGGQGMPTNTLTRDGSCHVKDVQQAVKNLGKILRKKCGKCEVPLEMFGAFIVKKPSNRIFLSQAFARKDH